MEGGELIPFRAGDEEAQAQVRVVLEALPMPAKFRKDGEWVSTPGTLANVIQLLDMDPQFEGRFVSNILTGMVEVDGEHVLTDAIEARIALVLAHEYKMDAKTKIVHDAVLAVAAARAYHPVQQYLTGLEWDGVPRADTWLTDLCGVEDDPITRLYARRWLVSCVARAMSPGCKVDTCLILQGAQGARKSSTFAALGGEWYAEGSIDPSQTKGSAEAISGAWIYELGELDSFRRADQTALKAFMSRQADQFRPAYGRNTVVVPRQCVFVGTTNEEAFLTDSTGNRRYWPVRVGTIQLEAIAQQRDQLWAEALVAYRAGETWWLTAEEDEARAEALERHTMPDPWLDELMGLHLGPTVSTGEVFTRLGIDQTARHSGTARRIASCLQALGYRQYRPRGSGPRMWRLTDE